MNANLSTDTQRAREALNTLDSGVSREEWVRIAMATKAAGLDFGDFLTWSEQAGNFKSEADCKHVWNSINPNGGIGPGTLFALAKDAGYRDEKPSHTAQTKAAQICAARSANLQSEAATQFWDRCTEATAAHPYILAKRGTPDGLRVVASDCEQVIAGHKVAGWLVVPVRSHDGTLKTLQLIPPPGTGKKLNMPGASLDDGFYIVGNPSESDRLFIVEGIGQAWACWSATGSAAVVCFGSSRMAAVASLLQRHYPTHKRILVPDRGKEVQAAEIARSASCAWVELPSDKPANYDANDYAQEYEGEELEALLKSPKYPPQRFRILTADEVMAIPRAPDLVRGVLPKEGLAAIGGPSGSGKSFVAMDLLGAVASGTDWFGLRTRRAPVLYVALEGTGGLEKRLKAYREKLGYRPAGMFLPASLDLLNDTDRAELIQAAKQAGAVNGVVCIDTLNRAVPGMDENSSSDMGKAIEALKQIQDALGGLVVVVHHTGKDLTKGLRGHSSLFAALDAVIEVSRDGLQRTWKVGKSKDDEDGNVYPFRLKVVQVGEDDEGEAVTSCYVEQDDTPAAMQRRKIPTGGGQLIVWNALGDLFRNAGPIPPQGAPARLPQGRPCLLLDDAIDGTKGRLPDEKKRQRERAKRHIENLIGKGLIAHEDGYIWEV